MLGDRAGRQATTTDSDQRYLRVPPWCAADSRRACRVAPASAPPDWRAAGLRGWEKSVAAPYAAPTIRCGIRGINFPPDLLHCLLPSPATRRSESSAARD